MVKNPPAMQELLRDTGLIPWSGSSSGEGVAPCFSILGQRSLAGYSQWARKGSVATERVALCLVHPVPSDVSFRSPRQQKCGSAPAFSSPDVHCL